MPFVVAATWSFGLRAVSKAAEILASDGKAIDAVEEGIKVVELDPEVLTVGLGGIPNLIGVCELDASIMDGYSLKAGAVGGVRNVLNPISVARKVLELTPHILLVGSEATSFASKLGLTILEFTWKSGALEKWKELLSKMEAGTDLQPYIERIKTYAEYYRLHETISIVALDRYGNLASGSSTTGLPLKIPGRVGDSAIIGAGVYADNSVGAACTTGVGEIAQITLLSKSVCDLMRRGLDPQKACEKAIADTFRYRCYPGGIAVLAIDRIGRIGAASSRKDFVYAYMIEGMDKPELKPSVYIEL
ncbi:MAG: N(4)-(beta-N-acetylglucosaminyl)-L-asparaginase [Candidatus Bathyarchaeota archaeon]|nr:N(4)-(beta-N-acetylglucosaminyl)-L-asparaginase [Candidatus Bathyarchaeota archaeon]